MKLAYIVGARPQFIKLGPLSQRTRPLFQEIIIHTGQHFDANMSDLFFRDLGIPEADYNLNIHSGGHGEQTGRMMMEIEGGSGKGKNRTWWLFSGIPTPPWPAPLSAQNFISL